MTASRTPANFYAPLAQGAPAPYRTLPVRLERMIHFIPPHIKKLRAKVPQLIPNVDVILGNLEDAIPADQKIAARAGFIELATTNDFGPSDDPRATSLWVRINSLSSPWCLEDVHEIVRAVGDKLDVIMLPMVCGPWDIHYLDQLLAQLEAQHQLKCPILIHAILETAEGVKNVDAIAASSPRMHGMSLGPADLAASRGMKTTRVGGGHPGYGVLADATSGFETTNPATTVSSSSSSLSSATAKPEANPPRAFMQQDLWHYTIQKMVDACMAYAIKPFYGPFGDFADSAACEVQFRNAFLQGCLGTWTLHPSQIDIAKRVFSPDPAEVAIARTILRAMPDGSGVAMVDGKFQDDATFKQAKVIVDLAKLVAARDKCQAAVYGFADEDLP